MSRDSIPVFRPKQAVLVAADLLHEDYAYIFEASWDLWFPSDDGQESAQRPVGVKFIVHGPEFDQGIYEQEGHIKIEFGLDSPFLQEEVDMTPEAESRVRSNVKKLVDLTNNLEPLVVQKPLYPEGDAVCHTILVHPPAGIAGGDELDIGIRLDQQASVLLTTPGAGKWYRSGGPWARMRVAIDAGPKACVEWLPQETIVFDGALADMQTEVRLAADAAYVGWDIVCFGRTGSGERYLKGECRVSTQIWRDGEPLWFERGRIEGGGRLLTAAAGLGGRTVSGTLLATVTAPDRELMAACRAERPVTGDAAITHLPGLLVARYLGDSSEAAKRYFERVWRHVRPALMQREAVHPRIWQT